MMMGLQRKYGDEPLGVRNMDSCLVRRGIAEAVRAACQQWGRDIPGGRVLDIGCGSQPYRPWLEEAGLEYTGVDWPESIHATHDPRVVRWNLAEQPWPFAQAQFDALLCTEVLEHLPSPWSFLAECARIAKPGARLLLTAPLLWPEHEAPHDYYRYTQYGLRLALEQAGFEVEVVRARGGWHTALAQMLGLWSYFAVPKPWNYATRLAVWPLMQLLVRGERWSSASSSLPLTLGYAIQARRKS